MAFSIPIVAVAQDGGPSASGRHLGWPHSQFPVPGMRSSKMAAGGGRAAILRHRHNGDRKGHPKSWLTSFPAPPSWIQEGGATSNVWRTSELPWKPQKGVVLVQKRPVDVWSYFFLLFYRDLKKKYLIVSLPQPFSKWLRELPACHYGEVDQSARVNTMKCGVDFGKHLLYFIFWILCCFFFVFF